MSRYKNPPVLQRGLNISFMLKKGAFGELGAEWIDAIAEADLFKKVSARPGETNPHISRNGTLEFTVPIATYFSDGGPGGYEIVIDPRETDDSTGAEVVLTHNRSDKDPGNFEALVSKAREIFGLHPEFMETIVPIAYRLVYVNCLKQSRQPHLWRNDSFRYEIVTPFFNPSQHSGFLAGFEHGLAMTGEVKKGAFSVRLSPSDGHPHLIFDYLKPIFPPQQGALDESFWQEIEKGHALIVQAFDDLLTDEAKIGFGPRTPDE